MDKHYNDGHRRKRIKIVNVDTINQSQPTTPNYTNTQFQNIHNSQGINNLLERINNVELKINKIGNLTLGIVNTLETLKDENENIKKQIIDSNKLMLKEFQVLKEEFTNINNFKLETLNSNTETPMSNDMMNAYG